MQSKIDFNAAIFDMDGTLVDSLHYWQVKWKMLGEKYFNGNDFSVPEYIDKAARTMKLCDAALYVKKELNVPASDDEIICFFNGNLIEYYKNNTSLKNGVEALLNELMAKNVKMCVATATEGNIARQALEYFGILKYFEFVLSCDDEAVNEGKERPRVFLYALEKLGVSASEAAVFDDSAVALQTAQGIGLKTVGIFDAHNSNQDLVIKCSDIYLGRDKNISDILLYLH